MNAGVVTIFSAESTSASWVTVEIRKCYMTVVQDDMQIYDVLLLKADNGPEQEAKLLLE